MSQTRCSELVASTNAFLDSWRKARQPKPLAQTDAPRRSSQNSRTPTGPLARAHDVFNARHTNQMHASWEARGRRTIKHHYLKHWAKQAAGHGNPSFYHTYADESTHRCIKRIAKSVHSHRFAERVLVRLLKRKRLA
jgi:hypothetical protein